MVAVKIENFGGMMLSRAPALLPDNVAYYAQNAWLYYGDIRTFRQTSKLYTITKPDTHMVYRIPDGYELDDVTEKSIWLEFEDPDVQVFRAPMVNDQWKRYYFFSPTTAPEYNTLDRIRAGQPNFLLGVPAPTEAIFVAPPTASTTVTRAYLYTWQTEYGEEGAPSPAAVLDGDNAGTWVLTIPPIPPTVSGSRNITKVNVYRTIADGMGSSTFYRVTQLDVSADTQDYSDSALDTTLTGAIQLPSTVWSPPPSGIRGVRVMPNGMVVAWTAENDLWFCEPYRPHAWPSTYTLSVEHPIVGLGNTGQSFAVLTQGVPYVGYGIHPATVALTVTAIKEPCISRGSIVSTEQGVFYASRNGLILLQFGGAGTAQNATAQLFSRQDWERIQPQMLRSTRVSNAYMGFIEKGVLVGGPTYDGGVSSGAALDGATGGAVVNGIHAEFQPYMDQSDNGFILGGSAPNTTYTRIKFPGLVRNVVQDDTTAENYIIASDGVYQWDAANATYPSPYLWTSKLFQFPYKQAFVAAKVFFDVPDTLTITPPTNATRNTSQSQTFDQTKQYLLLRVRANGNVILVREIIESGELILLPAGQKYDFWQFELEGQVTVRNIQAATSVKELRQI